MLSSCGRSAPILPIKPAEAGEDTERAKRKEDID